MKRRAAGFLAAGMMILGAPAQLPAALAAEARAAMARGADWPAAQQQPGGTWGLPDSPAMTGLAMNALQRTDAAAYADAINRAMVFILTSVQEDGSIWRTPSVERKGGGWPTTTRRSA